MDTIAELRIKFQEARTSERVAASAFERDEIAFSVYAATENNLRDAARNLNKALQAIRFLRGMPNA